MGKNMIMEACEEIIEVFGKDNVLISVDSEVEINVQVKVARSLLEDTIRSAKDNLGIEPRKDKGGGLLFVYEYRETSTIRIHISISIEVSAGKGTPDSTRRDNPLYFRAGSLKDYFTAIDSIKSHCKTGGNLLYRGEDHRYCSRCVPSLFRTDKAKAQKLYYDALRLYPHEFTGLGNLDILCKMQHYGLPTRLLDVSDNPLVALYFSSKVSLRDPECDWKSGFVYVFSFDEKSLTFESDKALFLSTLEKLTEPEKSLIGDYVEKYTSYVVTPFLLENDPLYFGQETIAALRKFIYEAERQRTALLKNHRVIPKDLRCSYHVYPRYSNARIKAQSGSFIVFGLGEEKRIREEIKNSGGCERIPHLFCVIEITNKQRIREELDLNCNVNDATMLLDTESCFKYLKTK